MSSVFVSYRRDDEGDLAERVCSELEHRLGRRRVFFDQVSIPPACDYFEVLDEQVKSADVVVVIIGPNWTTIEGDGGRPRLRDRDDVLRHEVATALHGNATVFPVLVKGAKMPTARELPEDLASLAARQAFELSDNRLRLDLGRLVDQVEKAMPVTHRASVAVGVAVAALAGLGLLMILVSRGGDPSGTTVPDAADSSVASAAGTDSPAPMPAEATGDTALSTITDDPTCAEFSSQGAAQGWYEARFSGWEVLDADGDGIACELLPDAVEASVVGTQAQAALQTLDSLGTRVPTEVVYDRDDWPHWVDADVDCQDTRAEVLVREARGPVTFGDEGCTVFEGTWEDLYTGRRFELASNLDIDHLVPLADAHDSGAWSWTPEQKAAYANDLDHRETLVAVYDEANVSKGGRSPDEWLPTDPSNHCPYAIDWVNIKAAWELSVTEPEREALATILSAC